MTTTRRSDVKGGVVIASNRLPFEAVRTPDGIELTPSPGGLVSALKDLLSRTGGQWVGWPGIAGTVDGQLQSNPFTLVPVELSVEEIEQYYHGFCNQVLWPLVHGLHPYCKFRREDWETYQTVNERFASRIDQAAEPGQPVWVHDYHLLLAGDAIRDASTKRQLGFFLHTPIPNPAVLRRVPQASTLLRAILRYDVVGLQTHRAVANFRDCVETLVEDATVSGAGNSLVVEHRGHRCRVGSFPISIDFDHLEATARAPNVEERVDRIRRNLPVDDRVYLLGVERLDYTKGITEKLDAFEKVLERFPELRENVTLIQHVNPSRQEIQQYQALATELQQRVGSINGRFGKPGWVPVHFTSGWLSFDDILALYRLADVALVTPLKDGMNLVAKEYCAASWDDNGVLVLSEFAGASEELGEHTLTVNPQDTDAMAEAIYEAVHMPAGERQKRMRELRRRLADHDVHQWAENFLGRLLQRVPGEHSAASYP